MQIVTRTPEQIICHSLCNSNIVKTVFNKSHSRPITTVMEFPTDEEAYEFFNELL